MTLVRVTVAGTIGKAVRINTDATVGATIGTNFKLPDGTVPTLGELADALYIQSPPGEFVPDTGTPSGGHTVFESEIVDGLLLARVADPEVITGAYTFNANLTMGNAIPVNWKDSGGAKIEFINFASGGGGPTAVGHIIKKLTAGVTTTSGTYVNATGAVVLFSEMEANENYAVFVRAYHGNSSSSTTAINAVRLTKAGVEVFGSEHKYESTNTVIDNHGHIYTWGGIINSGSSGDLQVQHLSGNGTDTVFVNNVTIMMIKVSDLTLNTNIFHDTDSSLIAIDDGSFPSAWKDMGVSITIGDGTSDYLVFGCMKQIDFLTGSNTVSTRVTDGTTIQLGTETALGDLSDELVFGFMQLWQAPPVSTTLRVEAKTTGFPVDKRFVSIIAIRLSDFTDYKATFLATSPDLGTGPNTLATVALTTTAAANYGFLSGAMGPNLGVVSTSDFIRNSLNGGADVTIAGSETQLSDSNSGATQTFVHFGVSADQALNLSDTIDADFVATDAATPVVYNNNFLVVFAWTVGAVDAFKLGNAAHATEILGTTVTVQAPLFATSYDGVLAANLLDKSVDETVSGSYTFANNVTKLEGAAVRLIMSETGVGANEGKWRFLANTEQFEFGTLDDAEVGSNSIMLITRTGIVVDAISFFAPITATSYSGILAANLLDRTVNEIVTGRWDFESDGSAPQLCIVDSDSNGAATRAFIEFLGKGDVLTGRMGYLSAASGIFTIDNALPNAGVELKSAGVQKLRVDIDGTTVTGTIFVDNTSGEKVVLRDTNSTGNAVLNFIAFKDMNDLRQGVIGFGSSSNDDLLIATDGGFGDILLNPQGTTALRASNTAVAINVPLTATSYDGILAVNLLDKATTETITANWIIDVGAGGPHLHIKGGSGGATLAKFTRDVGSDAFISFNAQFGEPQILFDRSLGTNQWYIGVDGSDQFVIGDGALVNANDKVIITSAGDLSATSFSGVLAANLLDRTATEDVTGSYTFSVGPTFFSAGTVGAPGRAFVGDADTGAYSPGANIFAITVGGVEAIRWTGASIPAVDFALESGITASTTQTQGQQPLTASYNEVAIVANDDDVVTLPVCAKGRLCLVINGGAKKLQLFPSSGVDLGQGVNSSVTIEPNSSLFFVGINPIKWHETASDKTYRMGHTYGVISKIKVPSGQKDFIIPFFVSLASGQTAKLVKARHKINAGTSVTCKLQKNDVDVTGFTAISVTTTAADTDPADVTLANDDKLALVVTGTSGTPQNMSFTIFIEYTQ